MKNDILSRIIAESHATIIEIPKSFGFNHAKKSITFPEESEILDFLPTIHDNQKTHSINVSDVEFLQDKIKGRSKKMQFVIFHDAQKINENAQNKLLKIVEEPRKNLKFIFITEQKDALLETIRSRSQIFKIEKISKLESAKILKKYKLSEEKARQILFLAEGLPEKLEILASDKKIFEQNIEEMTLAKKWLSGNKIEKMEILGKIKNREDALLILEKIIEISRITLNEKTAQISSKNIKNSVLAFSEISSNRNMKLSMIKLISKS